MKNGGQKAVVKATKNNMSEKSIQFAAETLIENALNLHATDVHIEPRDGLTLVRFRIHGVLKTVNQLPADICPKLVKYFKQISDLNLREKTFAQTGNYIHGKAKIRVSISPTLSGEKITLRLIRAREHVRKLDEIGLWGENLQAVRQAIRQPSGIILTVGEGKNTTNFALLDEINSPEKNIVTVENSIERTISGINQTQINPKIGLDFYSGTEAALNQNPDVILINDISNLKTAELAISASMHGKIIIASLPVRYANEALPFLVNLGISPFLLSTNIISIIGQGLIRTTTFSALDKKPISKTESKLILSEFGINAKNLHNLEKSAKKAGLGTKKQINFNTSESAILNIYELKPNTQFAFTGQTSLFEVINMRDKKYGEDLRRFMLSSPSNTEISRLLQKSDFITLKADGLVKSLRGETPLNEVLRKTGL